MSVHECPICWHLHEGEQKDMRSYRTETMAKCLRCGGAGTEPESGPGGPLMCSWVKCNKRARHQTQDGGAGTERLVTLPSDHGRTGRCMTPSKERTRRPKCRRPKDEPEGYLTALADNNMTIIRIAGEKEQVEARLNAASAARDRL